MTEEWKGTVGERLLKLRNQKGMTQEDLAEYLNVSRQSISKWELNKTLPDVEKLIQLSGLYEVTLDYLVKGEELIPETMDEGSAGVLEEEAFISTSEPLLQMGEGSLAREQDVSVEMSIYKTVYLLAMIVSGILCICAFVFSLNLLCRHSFTLDGKQQRVTYVNQIYEQYTLADVTIWNDEENYHKEKVWLDILGVHEGDYIGYYYASGNADKAFFEYYSKTIIVPLMISILLLIFTIIFWMGFRSFGGKRK